MKILRQSFLWGLMGISTAVSVFWACNQQSPAVLERRTSPLEIESNEADAAGSGQSSEETDGAGASDQPEANPTEFELRWQHADPSVYEYEVYAGVSREQLSLVGLFRNIEDVNEAEFLNRPLFSIEEPAVKIDALAFGYQPNGNFCTQIVAVNIHGKSQPAIRCIND